MLVTGLGNIAKTIFNIFAVSLFTITILYSIFPNVNKLWCIPISLSFLLAHSTLNVKNNSNKKTESISTILNRLHSSIRETKCTKRSISKNLDRLRSLGFDTVDLLEYVLHGLPEQIDFRESLFIDESSNLWLSFQMAYFVKFIYSAPDEVVYRVIDTTIKEEDKYLYLESLERRHLLLLCQQLKKYSSDDHKKYWGNVLSKVDWKYRIAIE
jgi:hypothetical protein